ncbi:MAG: hypothetical protein H6906_15275 [Hyphomicrobiales bacterium]|nr:hypothetical protein [Hyphomicrobiales bacterium]
MDHATPSLPTALLLGPFAGGPHGAWVILHLVAVAGLTVLTQVGGLVYWVAVGAARAAGRGWLVVPVFLVLYGVVSAAVLPVAAPAAGRVPLPCLSGLNLEPASPLFCLLNRHYVRPKVAEVAFDVAGDLARQFPGTRVAFLDGAFPFLDAFPILPHLTHNDGRKLDLALFYEGRAAGGAWPLGYLAFAPGAAVAGEACPEAGWRRWDAAWLQPLFADAVLDQARTAALVRALARHPDVGRVFFDGRLTWALGLDGEARIGRAGCHAARHDDHVHFRLR